ncbi:MAG: OST-HTH/LOTUS domain-containing protein, partial [Chloroflexi bacterium]|nr:OST-HTH/LOTUS domain-containing protein [Chloroflexota bacterium]
NLVAEHKTARVTTPRKSSRRKPSAAAATPASAPAPAATPAPIPEPDNENDPMPIIRQAYEIAQQEDGWARLDHMGNALYQLDPGFDPRTYGHRQLSRMIASYKDLFQMRTQEIDGSTLFYVKMKE